MGLAAVRAHILEEIAAACLNEAVKSIESTGCTRVTDDIEIDRFSNGVEVMSLFELKVPTIDSPCPSASLTRRTATRSSS